VKVLHIVPALFGKADGILGGAERYALELARNMAKQVETKLVTFGKYDRAERIGELEIRVIGEPFLVRHQAQNPFSIRLIPELLKVDVVHVHQRHILAATIAAMVCRLAARLVFVTDLGGGGWDLSDYFNTDRFFDGHLHISEYSRRISGHTNFARAHVVYGGVDAERFRVGDGRGRSLLFVGRLMPHKGVDILIDALPSHIDLLIVGPESTTDYSDRLHAMTKTKRVTFLGEVDDSALPAIYRSAFAVALPSVYRDCYGHETSVPELLGQTLLEGMACGLPAIATTVGSLPEVVENGRTGILVPPNDPAALREAITDLAKDRAWAQRMGAAGRERAVSRFGWEATVSRCLTAYSEKR
jgi:glycosyltransferase involved in cell wall biosynthesis